MKAGSYMPPWCHLARRRALIVGTSIVISMSLLGASTMRLAQAADWLIEGRAEVRTEYDDNILLDPDNELSVFGATLSPEIDIGGRSEIWDVFLTSRLDLARFSEEDNLDSEDVAISLDSNYRTQLGAWALDAEFSRTSTRDSELTDSGRLDTQGERLEYELLPSWTYTLTPRDNIFVNGGWNRASFDETTLDDFTYYFAGAGWNHQLTRQDDLTFSGFVSHFENDDVSGNETDTFGGQVEWHRVFSERLETRLAIGPRYTTTDTATPGSIDSDRSLGFIVGGSVTYDLDERTTVSGSLSHGIEPSGIGTAVERDTVDLSIRHQYDPLLTFRVALRYLENRDPNDEGRVRERDYLSITPGVRWEFERDWFLSAGYSFRTQEFEGESRAYSNSVFVTLSHSFLPWSFAD